MTREREELFDTLAEFRDPEVRKETLRLLREQREADETQLKSNQKRFLELPMEHFLEGIPEPSPPPRTRHRSPDKVGKRSFSPSWRSWSLAAALVVAVGFSWYEASREDGSTLAEEYTAALISVEAPDLIRNALHEDAFDRILSLVDPLRGNDSSTLQIIAPRGGILVQETEPLSIHIHLGSYSEDPSWTYRVTITSEEQGALVSEEISVEAGQKERLFSIPANVVRSPGSYLVTVIPLTPDGKEWDDQASASFHWVSKELVDEIYRSAPQTENALLNRQILASLLLREKDSEEKRLRLAALALEVLGKTPGADYPLQARAADALLRARAMQILGQDKEVKNLNALWGQLTEESIVDGF